MKTCSLFEVHVNEFLTLGTVWMLGLRFGRYTTGERAFLPHFLEGWVVLRPIWLLSRRNNLSLLEVHPMFPVIQPVA
jgi:hypothetical protein